MPWEADRTPGFSSIRITGEILPHDVSAKIRYGRGTISVELENTKDWRVAAEVAAELNAQGIMARIEETESGLKISRDPRWR
jgi:hypothetical protein